MTDSIPPMNRPQSQSGPSNVEEVVDHLVIKVDRLQQSNKLLRLVAGAALSAALAGLGVAGRLLYGWGLDDGTTRAMIDRCQKSADDDRTDIREIQRLLFFRRSDAAAGSGSGFLTPPPAPRSVP